MDAAAMGVVLFSATPWPRLLFVAPSAAVTALQLLFVMLSKHQGY
jgi:hypothetical protein